LIRNHPDNAAGNDHRQGLHALAVLAEQNADGTFGRMFHSLARPDGKHPLTTEQALRRLYALGFTRWDEAIQLTLHTLTDCLLYKRKIDDYSEKSHNWELFTRTMLAAWLRRFDPENAPALDFARQWAKVIEAAFEDGVFCKQAYLEAYEQILSRGAKESREPDFCNFYPLALLPGLLRPDTESLFFDYILVNPKGVYYLYDRPLYKPPEVFASLDTVRWLSAIELLSHYPQAKEKLAFAAQWINQNRLPDLRWDLGPKAKDGIHLPLSDSWRKKEDRIKDCTEWIGRIMSKLV